MPMLASNRAATANTVSNIIVNRRGAIDRETRSSIVRTLKTVWSLSRDSNRSHQESPAVVGTSIQFSSCLNQATNYICIVKIIPDSKKQGTIQLLAGNFLAIQQAAELNIVSERHGLGKPIQFLVGRCQNPGFLTRGISEEIQIRIKALPFWMTNSMYATEQLRTVHAIQSSLVEKILQVALLNFAEMLLINDLGICPLKTAEIEPPNNLNICRLSMSPNRVNLKKCARYILLSHKS